MMRKLVVAVVSVAVVAGCSSGGSTEAARDAAQSGGGSLVWAKPSEALILDPAVSITAPSWELQGQVYETLVGLDDNLNLVPQLAESWKQTSPATYVFTIRKGVKFSNGRELTADDVTGSLRRLLDPKLVSNWTGQLGMSKIETTGPGQVTVTLVGPKTSFVAALAATPTSIIPIKELTDGSFDPGKQLLGTGPFKVTGHSQNESWSLERNEHYWRPGLPKADKVTVRVMTDEAARVAALRDGSVDVTTFERPDTIRLLQNQGSVKTAVQETTDYYESYVNAKSGIFSDPRLREALALAVDRNKIRDVALAGVGTPTGAVPVAFDGVCDPASLPYGTPDLERAKSLVQAAGATGKTVEITAITQVAMASPIAQVLQQNLQEIGLKVRIITLESAEVSKRTRKAPAEFDLALGWFAGYADPAMVVAWWNPDIAGFNKTWVNPDPQLNTLINQSLATPAGPGRTALLRQACERAARGANILPLVSKDAIIAYRSDKVTPAIQKTEGYALPLRRLSEYGASGTR
jgi:peptide/nickel transport system substrate-binding protein